MSSDPAGPYATTPWQALLNREQGMLEPILAGVFGVWGLHLRSHASGPVAGSSHLLSAMLNLHVDVSKSFSGDLKCEPGQLPFANSSFQLIVAQHVFEQVADSEVMAAEIERVLAPEGVAIVFGFNPISLWRPWWRWHKGASPMPVKFRAAHAIGHTLDRQLLEVLQVRYSGMWWPWAKNPSVGSSRLQRYFGGFGASWLILARKRRSTLTPIRLRATKADPKRHSSLVPGTQRESA